ncbi:hypothetical protein HDU96_010803 [Phlyctochytrium bullatum]|nr:hypothetical protein HDU96_010803 [Phlyctochytrium bullatum]
MVAINKKRAVLWVDDRPENNKDLVDEAEAAGIEVLIARTTTDAINIINQIRDHLDEWDLRVITDMHRIEENNVEVKDAGLKVVRKLNELRLILPCLMYCSWYGNLQMWKQEMDAVRLDATSSKEEARKFALFQRN